MQKAAKVILGVVAGAFLGLALFTFAVKLSGGVAPRREEAPFAEVESASRNQPAQLRDLPLRPPRWVPEPEPAGEAARDSGSLAPAEGATVRARRGGGREGWRELGSPEAGNPGGTGTAAAPAGARIGGGDSGPAPADSEPQRFGPIVLGGPKNDQPPALADLIGVDGAEQLLVALRRLRDSGALQRLAPADLPRVVELMPDSQGVQEADRIFREQLGIGVGEWLAQQWGQ